MVELVWKGKQAVAPVDLINTKFQGLHLWTYERHPVHSAVHLTNPLPNSSSTWHNRLILGDKSYILPALFPEFAGKVNLIYIDPPFMTGRAFKNGEQLAYSDKWNNDLDTYLQWLYETLLLL
ncbi:MAG TPA: hypothetical protein VE843_12040, partial [Ktedonobacteraceae bacterium]|nr:hypothetical protein [Ktedonobacteraceae bacterium]